MENDEGNGRDDADAVRGLCRGFLRFHRRRPVVPVPPGLRVTSKASKSERYRQSFKTSRLQDSAKYLGGRKEEEKCRRAVLGTVGGKISAKSQVFAVKSQDLCDFLGHFGCRIVSFDL